MNNVNSIQSEVNIMRGSVQSVSVFAVIAAYYSRVLEQVVTVSQARAMVNAQCAFVALVMPLDLGYTYRVVALVWFALALLQCKIRLAE